MLILDNKEILAKAKEVKSVEELLALAKEHNIEATESEIERYFSMINPKAGELADEELDNVSGGACYKDDGRLIVFELNNCDYFEARDPSVSNWGCAFCKFSRGPKLVKTCIHPERQKR